MKPNWSTDEIIEYFTLLPNERQFLGRKEKHNRLGKALQLKFFQYTGKFPEDVSEIPDVIITYMAQQLDLLETTIDDYDWMGRRSSEHRKDIRELMGFRPCTLADQSELRDWLLNEIIPGEHRPVYLTELVYSQLKKHHIEPPSRGRVNRLITSALYRYEKRLFAHTFEHLSPETKARLRNLIQNTGKLDDDLSIDVDEILDYPIHEFKVGAGEAKIKNIKRVCTRLMQLQDIDLPEDLFKGIPLRFLRQYRQQVSVESPSHLRRRLKKSKSLYYVGRFLLGTSTGNYR